LTDAPAANIVVGRKAAIPGGEVPRAKPSPVVRLRIKRVYAAASDDDGTRILVDRLWPRGIAKAKARIDVWLRDVAPSTELRLRMHAADAGQPAVWKEFRTRYAQELEQEPARSAARDLLLRVTSEPVTLIYAARNETHNNAAALKAWLEARAGR
jgi:uncharacterized protein YeaO (DUF488 family)